MRTAVNHPPQAIEADLRQAKAALKVARAAAAEERSRREELEENFDAAVAEAVATAIAAAVAGKIDASGGPGGHGDSASGVLYENGDGSINEDWAGGHAPPIIPAYVTPETLDVKQEQPQHEDDGCRSGDGDGDGSARRGCADGSRGAREGTVEGILDLFCIPTRGIRPEVFCLPKPRGRKGQVDKRSCLSK